MKKITLAGIILAIALIAVFVYLLITNERVINPEQLGYTDVSPAQARELIRNNLELIIIDVSPNYSEGHLPGAVNYYIGNNSLDSAIPNLDKEAMYLVYCHLESASRTGTKKLTDAGFTNVYRLQGEYDAWIKAGYPVQE
jgi:rhodanese-related sulfurtransferase